MEARGSGRRGQGVEPQSEHAPKPHEKAGNHSPRHPRHLTAREISLPRTRRGLHVALRPFKNLPALFWSHEPVLVVARRLLNDPLVIRVTVNQESPNLAVVHVEGKLSGSS